MTTMKNVIVFGLLLLLTAGCGSESSNIQDRGQYHDMSNLFVQALNREDGGYVGGEQRYDVEKIPSNKEGFVVFRLGRTYPRESDRFFAVDIRTWDFSTNAHEFLAEALKNGLAEDNLIPQDEFSSWDGYTDYRHFRSPNDGFLYEKTFDSSKDRLKLQAVSQKFEIALFAEKLQAQYGLSVERSREVGHLVYTWERMSKSEKLERENQNRFFHALTGMSPQEVIDAAVSSTSGSKNRLDDIIRRAGEYNGITPEEANEFISKFGIL